MKKCNCILLHTDISILLCTSVFHRNIFMGEASKAIESYWNKQVLTQGIPKITTSSTHSQTEY